MPELLFVYILLTSSCAIGWATLIVNILKPEWKSEHLSSIEHHQIIVMNICQRFKRKRSKLIAVPVCASTLVAGAAVSWQWAPCWDLTACTWWPGFLWQWRARMTGWRGTLPLSHCSVGTEDETGSGIIQQVLRSRAADSFKEQVQVRSLRAKGKYPLK